MKRKPRAAAEAMLSGFMIWRTSFVLALLVLGVVALDTVAWMLILAFGTLLFAAVELKMRMICLSRGERSGKEGN